MNFAELVCLLFVIALLSLPLIKPLVSKEQWDRFWNAIDVDGFTGFAMLMSYWMGENTSTPYPWWIDTLVMLAVVLAAKSMKPYLKDKDEE